MSRARPLMWPDTAARSGRLAEARRSLGQPEACSGAGAASGAPAGPRRSPRGREPAAAHRPYISPISPLYLPYNSPIGELLPTAVRANGAATAFGVHWLCNIVIGNYFLLASQRFGVAACYSLFGGVALAGAAFCASQVPETKGRSLEEIEAKYAPASAAD